MGLYLGKVIVSGRTRNVQGTATVSQITMPEKFHSVPWLCLNGQLPLTIKVQFKSSATKSVAYLRKPLTNGKRSST